MKYLLVAGRMSGAELTNLLNGALVDSEIPKGVEELSKTVWLVDEHKALAFYTTVVHNANARNLTLSVFRIDELTRLR